MDQGCGEHIFQQREGDDEDGKKDDDDRNFLALGLQDFPPKLAE